MKIPFFKQHKNSFFYLNVTQFLGALNDNIFKLLIIYLLINIKGTESSGSILALAGAIFVLPFLLFSSSSGILADKVSKNKIIVWMKVAELFIMASSIVAIYFESPFFVYFLLFLMATQSTVFSPSKYGIIPELVANEKITKANGLITSFSYIAIIIGTFLASFLTDITNKRFVLAAGFCVLLAVLGVFSSLKIKKTKSVGSSKKINTFFLKQVVETLKLSYQRKYLLPSIFGSAFFLLVGSFVQLNIIPFAINTLNLSEVGGGYLFLSTAVGISIGSLIAGKITKNNIELSFSCLAGFLLSFFLIFLGLFVKSVFSSILILTLLGIFGGIFLIPFDSFIQSKSPIKKRGQIIATANFLSFLGVLISSISIYVLGDILKLSAAKSFIFFGIFTFVFTFINTGRLSDIFFPFLIKKLLKPFVEVQTKLEFPKNTSLVLKNNSWVSSFLLFAKIENFQIIKINGKSKMKMLNYISNNIKVGKLPKNIQKTTCFLLKNQAFENTLKKIYPNTIFLEVKKYKTPHYFWKKTIFSYEKI